MSRHASLRPRAPLAAATVLALLTFAGCKTVGPDYKRPDSPLPAQYQNAAPSAAASVPGTAWWGILNDPDLDALEKQAMQSSPNLASLAARIAEARARLRVADADKALSAQLGASSRLAGETAERTLPIPGHPVTYRDSGDTYHVGADLAYEVDLWGRVKRSRESANAQVEASLFDLSAAQLALQAELAQTLINLRELDAERSLVRGLIANRQDSLKLLQTRFDAGFGNELDLQRAHAELAGLQADLSDLTRRRTLAVDALALLCGVSPGNLAPISEREQLSSVPSIQPGLPASLLSRRPDLASAEATLHARLAEIGVAEAARYPDIRLTGSLGFESAQLDQLLQRPAQFWQLGPSLSLPLLDGGRTKANVEAAKARAEAAKADHRNKTLTALREVEDALVDAHYLAEQSQALDNAIEASEAAARLSEHRYNTGMVNYLELLDARRSALQYERNQRQVQAARLTASVRLAKALGGSW